MKHSTEFEATPGGLVLTTAILLYQPDGRQGFAPQTSPRAGAASFASIHPVEHVDGGPQIAAGAPLSRADLRKWTEALGRTAPPEILPANVLVHHADMLVWWVPEQVRPAYFALNNPPKDAKVLAKRTILPVPYPAHVLIATRRSLGVYALPASERPSADTPVLFSPILNVFIGGHLCWGNVPQPKALTLAAMAEYERALFGSWSTHPNPGQQAIVTGKGGLVKLWDDLAARGAKRFPVKRLKPFVADTRRKDAAPLLLGQLIAGSTKA